MGPIHNILSSFTVVGFFALGLSAKQVVAAILLSAVIVSAGYVLNGQASARYGVPFAMLLDSFGSKGALIPRRSPTWSCGRSPSRCSSRGRGSSGGSARVGNTVLRETDPSGHAEMVAVREACRKLGTLDVSGMVMYATCEPCPMCVAVMMWAGITECYYASTRDDAADNGFSDLHLRRYLDGSDTSTMDLVHLAEGREECAAIWTEFQALNG